ncbi:MAG TPA: hypothetical protein VOA87_10240, partial [Thermoanaerobaculia bacterium]|nr:hypothetical protein [Thermoanaerobaculia bacterium]
MLSFASSFQGRGWTAAAVFAAALFVPFPSRAAHAIDIGAARALLLGTFVTVEGSVTVPSGAFSSSTFDEGFAIQDRTGGIYVSVVPDLGLTVRRKVSVSGHLADNGHGVLTVVADARDVEADGRGPQVEPRWVSTANVSEATEGLLVQVVGTITVPIVPDPPFGTIIIVDDGSGPIRIFVCASTGIDVSGLAPGQRVSVTGLSYQFGDY